MGGIKVIFVVLGALLLGGCPPGPCLPDGPCPRRAAPSSGN